MARSSSSMAMPRHGRDSADIFLHRAPDGSRAAFARQRSAFASSGGRHHELASASAARESGSRCRQGLPLGGACEEVTRAEDARLRRTLLPLGGQIRRGGRSPSTCCISLPRTLQRLHLPTQ